jgi:hypothetical protein
MRTDEHTSRTDTSATADTTPDPSTHSSESSDRTTVNDQEGDPVNENPDEPRYPACTVKMTWPDDRDTAIAHTRVALRAHLRTTVPDREAERRVDTFTLEALHALQDGDDDSLINVIRTWVTIL